MTGNRHTYHIVCPGLCFCIWFGSDQVRGNLNVFLIHFNFHVNNSICLHSFLGNIFPYLDVHAHILFFTCISIYFKQWSLKTYDHHKSNGNLICKCLPCVYAVVYTFVFITTLTSRHHHSHFREEKNRLKWITHLSLCKSCDKF